MRFLSAIAPKLTGRGTGRILVSLGAIMSLVIIPASALTNLTGEYEFVTATDPVSVYAVNSNTASGSSGLQANSYGAGGKGVFGYSDASGAPGFGVAGISQNGYGVYGSSFGSGITAIYGENLSSGVGIGVQGSSANGTGVFGNGNEYGIEGQSNDTCSSGSCPAYAGVFGNDNAGSFPPAYGVVGQARYNHTGVAAFANSGLGLYAYSATGTGIQVSTGSIGGEATIGASTGEGGEFYGYSGSSADPALSIFAQESGTDLIGAHGASAQENFIVQYGTANRSGEALSGASDVQIAGDVYVYGRVFEDCNAFPAVSGTNCFEDTLGTATTSTSRGTQVQTYTAQQSTKTLEDFGEAQLVNGEGYVRLDPTFASTISRTQPYLVFITPEGDSHGLYVTAKSLSGFSVRESTSGRSTLAFQYRILAHPYGDTGVRMAAIAPKVAPAFVPHGHIDAAMLKGHPFAPPAIGARVARPPHVWVQNLHRQ
jgi:hypothetical protein